MGAFLILTGVVGLLSSFALTIDKLRLLANPDAVLACDLNPFFSCGSVMAYPQSEIFGFPNQLIGVVAFVVPIVLGVLLLTRVDIPRWVMNGLSVGLLGGIVLVTFLQYTSIFTIGVGCPWCMIVWVVTIMQFCVVVAANVLRGTFGRTAQDSTVLRVLASMPLLIAGVWLLIIATTMVTQFWTYFGSLI
ncbi:Uncharacterized membrane protein [Brevibacterium jeotgali]|uniref:Uncharacterized membrane protein n=2 Tax=Brevibacterium jeotgali TaxID=1262550 RepID=A0A2H1L7G0_9MICO|nr:Uncharacterized membrane protein [Brevibacterium jeotgali]